MKKFEGIITALATPFWKGELDKASFIKLLHFQMEQKVSAFVINGTTAESPCLSEKEVELLFSWAKVETAGQVPLILGAGGNCTKKTLEKIKNWQKFCPDAFLTVVPYYNRPPQRGLVHHFKELADVSEVPLILYNVPIRTSINISIGSLQELSSHSNIVAIKEASADFDFAKQILKKCPSDFLLLSGDDETVLELCELGACGGICVVSHILGSYLRELLNKIKKSEKNIPWLYKEKYNTLLKILYSESNPIGIKMALQLMGIFRSAEMRSPLSILPEQKTQILKEQLKKVELL